jgi:hypothetical protein
MAIQHSYHDVNQAFIDGSIFEKTDEELRSFLNVLALEPILNQNIQHREIIRAQTINDMLMQRHIERLDKQSAKTQVWFMVLAVLSLIATIVDIVKGWLF